MRSLWRPTCLTLMATLLAGPAGAEAYEIHAILPLTGGAAFIGQAVQQTMQVSEAMVSDAGGIRGRPVRFIYHDDQSTPQIAVQIANQVLATRPAVILGSSISANCNAMAPLMANGPVMYCLSPGVHPPAGSYVWSASVSSADYLNALLRYFRLKGWTRIAVITTIDSSGQDADRGIAEMLALPENRGMKLAQHAHFTPTDVNAAAQIELIKTASPQAIIVWATGASVATIFRGLIQAGVDVPLASSTSTMMYAQMKQYGAFLPKQLYFATPEWIANGDSRIAADKVVAAQQKQFFVHMEKAGVPLDAASETVWDASRLVVAALDKLGPAATAAQLRTYLAQLQGFEGVDGIYDFVATPQRGIDVKNTVVVRWNPNVKYWDVVSKPTGVPLAD